MSSYKMVSTARQITEDLGIRLKTLGAVQSVDASANATVTLGTLAAGNQCAFIRCMEQASIQTDGLGLAQRSYGPHVIQLVLETSTIAAVALMTQANSTKLFGELLKHGVKLEVYMTANTTVPSVSGITAGNLVATFDNLWQPGTVSM